MGSSNESGEETMFVVGVDRAKGRVVVRKNGPAMTAAAAAKAQAKAKLGDL